MFSSAIFNEIPLVEANITRKFINKMSRIYTIGANRNAGDRYNDLTILKSARMKHIERMTRLCGTIATRVVWNEGEEAPYYDYRPIYFFHTFFGRDQKKSMKKSHTFFGQDPKFSLFFFKKKVCFFLGPFHLFS